MSSGSLASLFQWAAILLALLGVIAQTGSLYYRNRASAESAAEIARLKGRTLSAEQKAAFAKALGPAPPAVIIINHRLMDGEGNEFANELAQGFQNAGWKLGTIAGNFLMENPGYVVVKTVDPLLQDAAKQIRRALESVGVLQKDEDIPANRIGGNFDAGHIYVVIGRK